MKRYISFILILSILVSALYIPAYSAEEFVFEVTEGGAKLVGYTGGSAVVTVPSEYRGSAVTQIGTDAFKSASSAYRIILPDTVSEIPCGAFSACLSLAEIVSTGGVYSSLDGVLYRGDTLVAYPPAKEGAFTLPSSAVNIADKAFYGAYKLKEAELSNAVSVGEQAFAFSSVTKVTFSDKIASISDRAFADCGLTGHLELFGASVGSYAFSGTDITGVTAKGDIADHAFSSCSKLVIASISSDIREGTFSGCTSLVSVYSPECTSIAKGAFSGASSLKYVNVGGTASAADGAFALCPISAVTPYTGERAEFTVSDAEITLRSYLDISALINFADAEYHVYSPSAALTADGSLIKAEKLGYGYLVIVTPYGTATDLRVYVKPPESGGITSVTMEDKLSLEAGESHKLSFGYEPLDAYPSDIKFISSDLSVITVDVDGTVRAVGGGTATVTAISPETGAYALCTVTVTESASGGLVYEVCDGYIRITLCKQSVLEAVIPEYIEELPVTEIARSAFAYCTELTKVHIPKTVTKIADGAFVGCVLLKEISVDQENSAFKAISGALYNKSGEKLLAVPAGIEGSFSIAEGCKTVAQNAFGGCIGITDIAIPSTVTSLTAYAFDNCISLEGFSGGSASYKVEDGVLYNADITSLVFYPSAKAGPYETPSTLLTIPYGAFKQCTSLDTVHIGKSVKSIVTGAFHLSKGIAKIEVDPENTYYRSVGGVLYSNNGNTLISVPPAMKGTVTVESGTASLAAYCFANTMVSYAELPDTLKTVSLNAFENCAMLSRLHLPESVTYIEAGAFAKTTISVYIPSSAAIFQGADIGPVHILCADGSKAHQYALDMGKAYTLVKKTVSDGFTVLYPDPAEAVITEVGAIAPLAVKVAGYSDVGYFTVEYLYGSDPISGRGAYIAKNTVADAVFALYGGRAYELFFSIENGRTVFTVPEGAYIAVASGKTEKAESKVTIVSPPDKTEYFVGDTFDTKGLFICVTDGYGITTGYGEGIEAEYDFSTPGDKTVTFKLGEVNATLEVSVSYAVIAGTVGINGAVRYGSKLTVNADAVTPNGAAYITEWFVGGVKVADGAEYTPVKADIGKKLYVKLTGSEGYDGELSSAETEVLKALPAKPHYPEIKESTSTSITLVKRDGYEYRLSGGEYTENNVFTGLIPGYSYTVYQRIAETDTHEASDRTSIYVTLDGYSKITSDKYFINRTSLKISKIEPSTTVRELLSGINEREYVKVFKNGKELSEGDLVGTGCELRLIISSETLDTLTVVITGDINGDGKITLTDYANLKKRILNGNVLEGAKENACDINGDGKTTMTDYARLKMHLLGTREIVQLEY